MFFYTSSIIFILIQVSTARTKLKTGELCNVNTNIRGICQPLSDCTAGMRIIRNTGRPKICSFLNKEPIVCCPQADNPSQISLKKCKEYGSNVFKLMRHPIPIVNAPYSNVSVCAIIAKPLLVSGIKATSKEFPHMALIGYGSDEDYIKWACDGSMISERYILTSAECVHHQIYGEAQFVRLGNSERNRNRHKTEIQYFKVTERIKHPNYEKRSRYNDIGLLKLNTSAIISSLVRPICLYDKNETPDMLIASGLGGIGADQVSSNDLQKTTLQSYSKDKCSSSYPSAQYENVLPEGIRQEIQFCAGSGVFGDDICGRFSGGPLQILHEEVYCMYTLVGIKSFDNMCEETNQPGIYTRVSAYIPWIESIVWSEE